MKYTATAQFTMQAPINEVWKWLTQPELVKQYFFGTNLVTSWEVGTPVFWRGEWEGTAYEDKGTVLKFDPPRAFKYTYLSSWSNLEDKPENYQVIAFTLNEVDGSTHITIVQSDIPTEEQKDHSAENWGGIMEAMKALIEK